MEDLLRVGVITATHGIRGEVKVFPTTDDPQRFKKLKQCVIEGRRENIELEVQSVKFFKQYVIIKFKGYDSINDIEQFVKKDLMVTREHAVKCEPRSPNPISATIACIGFPKYINALTGSSQNLFLCSYFFLPSYNGKYHFISKLKNIVFKFLLPLPFLLYSQYPL